MTKAPVNECSCTLDATSAANEIEMWYRRTKNDTFVVHRTADSTEGTPLRVIDRRHHLPQ